MRKQSAKTRKIIDYLSNNPLSKASAVAKRFNVHVSRVYQLRKKANEEFINNVIGMPDEIVIDDTPMPTPEHEAAARTASLLREVGMTDEQRKERTRKFFETAVIPAPTDVDGVLDARAVEYGKFKDGAALMQSLKRTLADHAQRHGKTFADDQWEALEMIVHKIGRIVNGNPDKVDHWTDIAGYAKLVADRLEGNAR